MKEIHCNYSNIPCQGKDCVFFLEEYEERIEHKVGRYYGGYNKEPFVAIWHGQRCLRDNELGKIRQEIYDRADDASNNIHKSNKYKIISTLCKKSKEAFDKIADEWRNMKCPFYEKIE